MSALGISCCDVLSCPTQRTGILRIVTFDQLSLCLFFRYTSYSSALAQDDPEFIAYVKSIQPSYNLTTSIAAVQKSNLNFVAPNAALPFPFIQRSMPASIVSPDWASLRAPESRAVPHFLEVLMLYTCATTHPRLLVTFTGSYSEAHCLMKLNMKSS